MEECKLSISSKARVPPLRTPMRKDQFLFKYCLKLPKKGSNPKNVSKYPKSGKCIKIKKCGKCIKIQIRESKPEKLIKNHKLYQNIQNPKKDKNSKNGLKS